MCIAGVMGGHRSGVTEETTDIFLESAYFDPTSVRKTAERHQLKTDAANRFEKGADPDMVIFALQRAAHLIQKATGDKVVGSIQDVYPHPISPFNVQLDIDYVHTLVGKTLSTKTIKSILQGLDIEVENESKTGFTLKVPPYRADVTRPADVVEELLRIYGYNNIEFSETMKYQLAYTDELEEKKVENIVSDYLVHNGFYQMMNNSLLNSNYLKQHNYQQEHAIPMLNYSSADLDVLRPTLLFSGLEMLLYNQNRQNADVKSFEFGKIYRKDGKNYSEECCLSLFMTGRQSPPHWKAAGKEVDFFQLKGYVENVFELLGLTRFKTEWTAEDHILEYGLDYQVNEKTIAHIGEVNTAIRKDFDLQQPVFFAHLAWEPLLSLYELVSLKFEEIPKYPAVERDLALLLDDNVSFLQILERAYQQAGDLLQDVQLFDVYEGENIEKGKKSYAVRFVLQDKSATLTDERVDKVMNKLIADFKQQLGAKIR
jgi:phenylalanyl-tRNA synthetase beta chain